MQILASGRVQGVNYRWFVLEHAQELGLLGWVRNLPDGRVEAEVEGPRDKVEQLIERMRKGPRLAHVTDLDVTPLENSGEYREFRIR